MSKLIINNYLIDAPIVDILEKIKSNLTNGMLNDIYETPTDIRVSCPFHKSGLERNPSCNIYCGNDKNIEYGYFRCFTCGEQGPLYKFVAYCLNLSLDDAKEWLVSNFGKPYSSTQTLYELEPIILPSSNTNKQFYLDESILDSYQSWHPYMEKRKLNVEVCKKFKVKYDPISKCIVFPVWDERGNLKFLTKRSVETKKFIIPPGVEKPIYLLNFVLEQNLQTVIVVESQINALTCWGYGIPAIALFGTGSSSQYDILNKSSIRNYILMFDGDDAGRKGATRFLKNIRKDVLVDDIVMPYKKDVNDLSEEQFFNLLKTF